MLRQQVWRDGKMVETEPVIVNWREPVIHVVNNIGDLPLRELHPANSFPQMKADTMPDGGRATQSRH